MSGRIVQAGDIPVRGFFVASGLGATGHTVTINVWRLRSGSYSEVVTAGSATEIGDGLYGYTIGTASVQAGDEFGYVFKTSGTADQKNVAGEVRVESNFTTTISGRIDAAVSSRSTLTAAQVWDYLSSAANTVGSLGKRIVDYLTGDVYARVGAPVGASISADIADIPNDVLTTFTNQVVTVRSPVLTESAIEVAIGTDYNTTYGNQFQWSIGATPNLTGFTLTAIFGGITIADCTITGAGTATQVLTVEPTAAETAQITQGRSEFSVIAVNTTPNPDVYLGLVRGKLTAYTVL